MTHKVAALPAWRVILSMLHFDKPVLERRRMGLELNGWRGSNKVLEIVHLDKGFPHR